MKSYWLLKDLKGVEQKLATRISADVYKNKKTGREYVMSRRVVLFKDQRNNVPTLIEEDKDNWEFFVKKGPGDNVGVNLLEEIYVKTLLD